MAWTSAFSCLFMRLMIACCSRVRSAPFVALAICKAFQNSTVLMSHAWCHGRCPILVFPRGWSHFPVIDAGGSPFPHNEGASIDSGITVAAGTTGSGAACVIDPTGGSTVWGPSSTSSMSGSSGMSPEGTSSALVSRRCHFLELLLSVCSAMSESKADSHSCHLRDVEAEVSFCFPFPLTSFWRSCSSDSTLQRRSFSESSCSCNDLAFFTTSWYLSQYHDSLPWALSMASSSMRSTTRGHAVRKANSIQ